MLKFEKIVNVDEGSIWRIENGKLGLGKLRIKRITGVIQNSELDFSWPNIKSSFEKLNSKEANSSTWFNRLSKEKLREMSIKGLKSKSPTKSESIVRDVLNKLSLPFEFQSPLEVFKFSSRLIITDFAIPDGVFPKIIIETTDGKIEKDKNGDFLSNTGNTKLIQGLRIKRFLPNVSLFLFATGKIDDFSKKFLSECFDKIFLRDEVKKLKECVWRYFYASQN